MMTLPTPIYRCHSNAFVGCQKNVADSYGHVLHIRGYNRGMTNTHITTVSQLTEGDIVLVVGDTAFDAPSTVTKVTRYNGTAVAIYTDNGGFWPVPAIGANTRTVLAVKS